jgi:hypothetical protein
MIARKLTENSYILKSDLGNHVALAWYKDGVFISTHDDYTYESLEAIAAKFSEKLTIKKPEKDEEISNVLGYPIKHSLALDIQNPEGGYPTYKTKDSSNTRFAAGWWVVPFESGYRAGMSPKTSTLIQGSAGPFFDRFTANLTLNNLSKRKELEKSRENR